MVIPLSQLTLWMCWIRIVPRNAIYYMRKESTKMTEITQERWTNKGGRHYIWFMPDPNNPSTAVQRAIRPNQGFTISHKEKAYNQDMIARENMDPFQNGNFIPATEMADTPSAITAPTPNAVSDEDIEDILGWTWHKRKDWLGTVSNPITLQRVLKMAKDTDATAKTVEHIESRIEELSAPEGKKVGTKESKSDK